MGFLDRLSHAWNAFLGKGPPFKEENDFIIPKYVDLGSSSSRYPDRLYFTRGQEKSLISTIYNRIAVDVAAIDIKHVRLDEDGRFSEVIESPLNERLNVEANKDQTGRAFLIDLVMSMLDEGYVAVVPIDTSIDPAKSTSFDIESMRVGKILQWYPDNIQVEVYNDRTGLKEQIIVPKKTTAIIENPFFAIMNEHNSILQRLIKKFNLLDVIDAQSGSGKLNMIVQLPYVIKTDMRREQAEQRRKDIENQLANSQYGIAYTDGTEKITQLNRPLENNMLSQIQYLTSMLYSQLGMTESILNGTADEKTMINYQNRVIAPIQCAITEEFRRKFLTKTARTQGQSIMFFNNPFRLVQMANIAEMADKFTRNEIMTSNEIRQVIGLKPSDDPAADELRNKNLNEQAIPGQQMPVSEGSDDPDDTVLNSAEEQVAKILAVGG